MPTATPPITGAGLGLDRLCDGGGAARPPDADDDAEGQAPPGSERTGAEHSATEAVAAAARVYAAVLDRCLEARLAVGTARAKALSVLEEQTGGTLSREYRMLSDGFASLHEIIDPMDWSDDDLEPVLDRELLDALRNEIDPPDSTAIAAAGALTFALAQLRRADATRAAAKAALYRAVIAPSAGHPLALVPSGEAVAVPLASGPHRAYPADP